MHPPMHVCTHTHTHTDKDCEYKQKVCYLANVYFTVIFVHCLLLVQLTACTSTQLVWLQRDQACSKYRTGKHSIKFWTLTSNTAILSFDQYSHWWWCTIKLTLFAKGSAVQKRQPYFDYYDLTMTLTERQKTNLFSWHLWWWITIPSLVRRGCTVQKMSSRWTFSDILNLHFDLDHEHRNPKILQGFQDVPPN